MLDGMRSNAQSWGVKLAVGLIILVFVFWGIGSVQSPTGVVAEVNGSQITMREFQRAYSRQVQELQSVIPNITEEQLASFGIEANVLQSLVMLKLLEQEATRTGINISLADFRNAITSMPYFQNEEGKFDKEIYEKILANSGQSVAEFEAAIRQDLLPARFQQLLSSGLYVSEKTAYNQYLFGTEQRNVDYVSVKADPAAVEVSAKELEDRYTADSAQYQLPARIQLQYVNFAPDVVANKLEVTEDELKTAYDARVTQFQDPAQVKARHILLQIAQGASEADDKAVLERIQDLEKRIRGGEAFADIAMEFGEDGTKEQGGDLGWFAKNQMVPTFAEAAFTLNIGELSTPVRTNFGYHLILVEDKKDATTRTYDEVKDELKHTLLLEKANTAIPSLVDSALLEAANNTSLEDIAKANSLEVITSPLLDSTAIKASLGLQEKDVQVLMAAEKGQLWDSPISISGGLALVKVLDITPAMTQPLAEVQDEIKAKIAQAKALENAKERAAELVKTFEATPPSDIQESAFFNREGTIEGLGTNADMAKAVFASEDKNWIATPFVFGDEVLLVRFADKKLATEADFAAIKTPLLADMQNDKARINMQRYMMMLYSNAEVNILLPELFAPKQQ